MHFSAYITNIYTEIALISLAGTCALSWWKGGATERLGSLALAVTVVGTHILRILSDQLVPTAVLFGSDVVLSFAFLVIAVRYSSLWLGAAMLFQALCFALHAVQFGDEDAPRWHGMIIYLLLNNILYYLVQASLVGGTLATIRMRVLNRKAASRSSGRASITAARLPLASSL